MLATSFALPSRGAREGGSSMPHTMSTCRRLACLCLALLAVSAAAEAPTPQPDEKEIAALVDQMGSPSFSARDEAGKKLKELGPGMIPALRKYVDYPDPEVSVRVRSVIKSFDWMNHGAIVVGVDSGSQAQKLGIIPGDVLVRVNGTDITGHLDLRKLDYSADRVYQIWRNGVVRTVKAGPGLMGQQASNWDLEKGGSNHSRGLTLLHEKQPNYDEAYKRLRLARAEGMTDAFTLGILSALAERQLDHAYAMQCYRLFSKSTGASCGYTHMDTSLKFGDVPFAGPHTAFLLERYHNEAGSPSLYHDLEDWFTRHGRNYPLAHEVMARPWPNRAGVSTIMRLYDDMARMRVDVFERKYDDALADYARCAPSDEPFFRPRLELALVAALRAGKVRPAVDIGLKALSQYGADGRNPDYAAMVFESLTLAAITNDSAAVGQITSALAQLDPARLGALTSERAAMILYHPAVGPHLTAFLDKHPEVRKQGRFEHMYLAHATADPAMTAGRFEPQIGVTDLKKRMPMEGQTILTGLLRFGECERARELSAKATKGSEGLWAKTNDRVAAVADFTKAHQEVKGIIQAAGDTARNSTWALRWDGHVFQITSDDKVEEYPGLDPPPAPLTVGFEHLRVTGKSVAVRFPHGRSAFGSARNEVADVPYVFDAKARRWQPVTLSPGDWDVGGQPEENIDALAMREVAKNHPLETGRLPRRFVENGAGGRWFEGDIFVYVDGKSRRVLDCSAEIGRQSGRGKPARVYAIDGDVRPRQVLFSDAGAWLLDTIKMQISRIPLGLKDENVMTCSLPAQLWGRPKDCIYVGVAPQDGGELFKVDARTFKASPTGGYCGVGPDDWFAHTGDLRGGGEALQDALHQRYLERRTPR
jgi:hypothetical protein